MIEHSAPISGMAAFGELYVATAGYDNQVILWDAASRRSIARGYHDHLANQVRFSPCGRYLLSSSSDQTARLWEIPSMRLLKVLSDHDDDVEAVAFHPSKPFVATASRDHSARVFDASGNLISLMIGHSADVISVEWTSDGDHLITSSDDGTVKKWTASTGALQKNFDLGGVETDTVVVAPDGTIFAGNDNGEIVIICADGSSTLPAHTSGIKRLLYDVPSQRIVSLSYDRRLCVWSWDGGSLLSKLMESQLPIEVWPRSGAFLGKESLALATFGTSFAVLNLTDGSWDLSRVKPTPGINAVIDWEGSLYSIGDAGILWRDGLFYRNLPSLCNFFCPIGAYLLTGGQSGEIFDALTGHLIYQHRSPLNCAVSWLSPTGPKAAIGTYTGEAILLSIGQEGLIEVTGVHTLQANAIKGLSSNAKVLASVGASGAFVTHCLKDFHVVHEVTRAHDKISNGCAAVSGGRFASVSRDLKLRIWSDGVATVIDTPHTYSIKCVASDDSGDLVATASYGGFVAIYRISSQEWTVIERPTSCGISSIIYHAADKAFLASSYDGQIYKV